MTGRRVLVVDDHAGFRATVRRLLESDGWTVVGEAADGAAALAAAGRLRPDAVLLDVGLPDLDGFAVAERMAADGIRGIVLTSNRDEADYGGRVGESIALSAATGFIGKRVFDGAAFRALIAGETP